MICRFFHHWGVWEAEFEEMPDGWSGTYQISIRRCQRPGCGMFEEVTRCVSLSPEVVRGRTQ